MLLGEFQTAHQAGPVWPRL